MRFVLILVFATSCSSNKIKEGNVHYSSDEAAYLSTSDKFMVASQGKLTSRAGIKMIELGGNAFDAFAAMSFAISVERPFSTGIGGGGFLTYFAKGMAQPETVDFREMAPADSSPTMFLDSKKRVIKNKSLLGAHAVGVPGLVAGVLDVHEKFGRLSRETVLQPAIELAVNGFNVYPELAKKLQSHGSWMKKIPQALEIFYKKRRKPFARRDETKTYDVPLEVGDRIRQKKLGKVLQTISSNGVEGFYQGWVASSIIGHLKKLNGKMTLADLRNYQVKNRLPVIGTYKDYQIYSMGPPSSGGTHIIQMFNMLEDEKLSDEEHFSIKAIHLIVQAMQRAFVDRAEFMGDSDFIEIPLQGLLSKKYAKKLKSYWDREQAVKSATISAGDPEFYESDETTHFSIMDKEGNALSSTQSINGPFGSQILVDGTGIILNNQMDDFANKEGDSNLYGAIGSEGNLPAPRKRPLSSMSPTIIFKKGRPFMALGSPGGTRIITCVAQVALNVMEYEMPLYQALKARRVHHQWRPDQIEIETGSFSEEEKRSLLKLGHQLYESPSPCRVQAVMRQLSWFETHLIGTSDPRGEGLALGL